MLLGSTRARALLFSRGMHLAIASTCIYGALVTPLASCASDADDSNTDSPDGGESPGFAAVTTCPEQLPEDGTICALPEGTTCAFGTCGTPLFSCLSGTWRHATNPPPASVCPSQTPEDEAGCPACWSEGVTCTYGSIDCTAPDASLRRATASCDRIRWTVAFEPCRDAGPDVQGDAEPDAD